MPPLSRRFSMVSTSSASASVSSCRSVSTTFSTFSQKSVQFVVDFDVRNTTHVYDTEATTEALWFASPDYEKIKREVRNNGCDLEEEGYEEVLDEAYGDNTHTADDAAIQHALNDFAKLTDGRGIERYISRTHYQHRSACRKKSIQAVLKAQQQARAEGLTEDALEERLRETYLHSTIVARTFARRLGRADEACCAALTPTNSQHERTPTTRTTTKSKLGAALKSLVMGPPQKSVLPIPANVVPRQIVALHA